MDSRALKILEFDLVKEMVGEFATSDVGREMIRQQEAATSSQAIHQDYDLGREMMDAVSWREPLPMDGLCDTRPLLKAVEPAGSYLAPLEFLKVRRLLKSAAAVRRFFRSFREDFPLLRRLTQQCEPVPEFQKEVDRALTPDGEVSNDATLELTETRNAMDTLS